MVWPLNPEMGHEVMGTPPFLSNIALLTLLKATSLLAPKIVWRPCKPVTIQHLEYLCICLDFDDLFDAAIFDIACLAFWLQA